VRDWLTQHGVPFVERNIRRDAGAKDELLARTGDLLVPVVFVRDAKVVGWDEPALSAALGIDDRAG
jgi:glutaredoxin